MSKRLSTAVFLFYLCGFFMHGQNPILQINENYLKRFDRFFETIDHYNQISVQTHPSNDALRNVHRQTRNAYKELEYLWTFRDPQGISDFINGAPLLAFERHSPSLSVLEPQGLQVLDELVHEPVIPLQEVRVLVSKLEKNAKTLYQVHRNEPWHYAQVFYAMRLGLIRLMSMGITGFDTPGSLNGIEESAYVIKSMQADLSSLSYKMPPASIELFNKCEFDLIQIGLLLKSGADFDTFDRYGLIKNYLQPLYGRLLKLQLELGIETPDEVSDLKQPINYMSDKIFGQGFLDPYYFTHLTKAMDGPEMFALGEKLFNTTILSASNDRACVSCHDPLTGFSDGMAKSLSGDGKTELLRNSMTMFYAIFADKFFWDLRSHSLDQQIDHVVHNKKEFNTNYQSILKRLNDHHEFKQLFRAAFGKNGSQSITKADISAALSSYLIGINKFNNRFDVSMNSDAVLTDQEVDGFNLFMGKAACATCHFAPTFSGLVPPLFKENESEVLGVLESAGAKQPELDADFGRYANGNLRERAPHTKHAFKTVTVRNVEHTAPYMHNGAFATLEEVMDFYNNGGGIGHGIELENQTLAGDSLHLSQSEIDAIIAFMKTLSDNY